MARRAARENYCDFLMSLYLGGTELSPAQINLLVETGRIKDKIRLPSQPKKPRQKKPQRDFGVETKKEAEIDQNLTVIGSSEDVKIFENTQISTQQEYSQAVKIAPSIINTHEEIYQDDWMPESVVYHKRDFVDWIDSINSGFKNRRPYKKFDLYVQQARNWYAENDSTANYDTHDEKFEYAKREFDKCRQSSLYGALKYGYLQESSLEDGRRKYVAGDDYVHHHIICYLMDCGYSFMLGKPRQIGSTSIIGLIAVFKMILNKNFFLKFITEDEKTGLEIFDDKIKYAFSQLPPWFKPTVLNDRDRIFRIGKKSKQSGDKGINSRIEVVPPSRTAINGGSPQVVLIDEIGSIPILTDMINEGRPTMYWKDPETGKLIQRRQLLAWGTGTTGKGGGSYEKEWERIYGLWRIREFSSGIVPVFFDWTTRCSEEEYIEQKKYYYGSRSVAENVDSETSRIQFHQHFPSHPRDMFMLTDKTLVSREYIESNLNKIRNMDPELMPKYGYFIPVFDKNKPVENSDVPFKVIGAEFVPVNDSELDMASAIIMSSPKKGWINRYYQGTDPIASDTGTSKMASAIWDKNYNTIAAIVNFREPSNPKASFLQALLLGLYYDVEDKGGVRELVEKNIGLAYTNYKESKGFMDSLVINSEIEDPLQSGNPSDYGIDNKGVRNKFIISRMSEMFLTFGKNIYIDVLFSQLTTFVCKITRTGTESWGPLDNRYYYDDALFAAVYAYICARSFDLLIPRNVVEEKVELRQTYAMRYDKDFNLVRVKQNNMVRKS